MAPKKKTVTTPKPIRDLSSPSAGSQQRVVVVSQTSSALSDGSLSPLHHPATSTKLVASSSSDSNNKAGSQGASALATSMGLIESNHLESSTGRTYSAKILKKLANGWPFQQITGLINFYIRC